MGEVDYSLHIGEAFHYAPEPKLQHTMYRVGPAKPTTL